MGDQNENNAILNSVDVVVEVGVELGKSLSYKLWLSSAKLSSNWN